jgi:hypothetical protein
MAGPVDAFLKLSIAVSLLGAAVSVGYYYSVYLPRRDIGLDNERRLEKAHAEFVRKLAEERDDAERLAAEQRQAQEKAAAQVNYEACINRGNAVYNVTWASNCKRLADEARKNRASCTSIPSTCDLIYPARDAGPNCALPHSLADSLNADLNRGMDRCLQENKAGLQ